MFETTVIASTTKAELYHQLAAQARALVQGEPDDIANLSNVSALLNLHLEDVNWVGFYLWHSDTRELVLGPFQGKPACIRIGYGKGVCGNAAMEREAIVVEDVTAFPGHIACDGDSRSEIVIPLIQGRDLIGVLDIDSPHVGRFDSEDRAGLTQVVAALMGEVKFPVR